MTAREVLEILLDLREEDLRRIFSGNGSPEYYRVYGETAALQKAIEVLDKLGIE